MTPVPGSLWRRFAARTKHERPWTTDPLRAYDRGHATGLDAGRVEAARLLWEVHERVVALGFRLHMERRGAEDWDIAWVKRDDVLAILAEANR